MTAKYESVTVKEQRVDGSYTNLKSSGLVLRCTLYNFERKFLIGISPNSINKFTLRSYSTRTKLNQSTDVKPSSSGLTINPSFISGFIDGEGCFSVVLVKDRSYKLG
ncbi:hypothetical protein GCM10023339_57720 [Alloalcanivorax gelatiniphagus]